MLEVIDSGSLPDMKDHEAIVRQLFGQVVIKR